jgi:predicted dithiol-disulfide oxidoreductase (DUF899 family)
MTAHKVVSPEAWLAARLDLLEQEKAFTRARDALSQARRDMPWERVEKAYGFTGPQGSVGLADLFAGKSQLIVYHFMFAPEWEAGCRSCSFWADNFERIPIHLAHRDIAFCAVSRAPFEKLQAYARRMGWTFPWYSADAGAFAYDYGASWPEDQVKAGHGVWNYRDQPLFEADATAISVFARDEADGAIFHTYSAYQRGVDMMNGAYHYIDLTPKGREEPAVGNPQFWVRRRDEYPD